MSGTTRRDCLKGAIPVLTAANLAASPERPQRAGDRGMMLSELFYAGEERKMKLAAQVGVRYAIVSTAATLAKVHRDQYLETLTKIRSDFKAAGLTMIGVESHPVSAEKIKLGLPGRDEEIENYRAVIAALGRLGIPILCYNFMAGIGWYRTRTDVSGRGGALCTEFDNAAAKKQGLTEFGAISEEKIWANLEYFVRAVMPAADKAGVKMALHPDDPPISPLRGIGRVLTSARSFRRVLDMADSPRNGITFCQANFKLMGEDIEALAREWGPRKIFFVHFRDEEGTRERFHETFHDNGPTDMPRMLKVYNEIGFDGPIRPDHAPTLEGESNEKPGYAMSGKLFAFGYMKGILETLGAPYR
jgi:mannonate dehydratase